MMHPPTKSVLPAMAILLWVFAAACSSPPNTHAPIDSLVLHGGWVLSSPDTALSCGATVPGTVHTDLHAAGLIADPFYGSGEADLAWIERFGWEYTCQFIITPQQLSATQAELVFEGLDTYATVWLNGTKMLNANNMFRSWTLPVNGRLIPGTNTLKVAFDPPVRRHAGAADSLGFTYPADNDASRTSPFVRKAAYHFGWDWAPRFVTSGIWQPVHLHFYESAALREVWIEQLSLSDTLAQLRAHATVAVFRDGLSAKVEVGGHTWTTVLDSGEHEVHVDFDIANPRLWWPNGEGEAALYPIALTLSADGVKADVRKVQVGLRTIELVNAPDSIGTSFYFKVNGRPVFAKGANYVPQDVFLSRVSPARYRELLTAARDAHMNMLRVWGGGVYERELFYHLCDSLGIMVWQDFMFAGTMYPGDVAFLANVEAEAVEQVKRLRKHPSIALWCGNNEIEVAWNHWGWQRTYGYSAADSSDMWSAYLRLFEGLLPQMVEQHSPHTAYIPSSPQRNWGTADNFNHGAMHYWGVWHGREPLTAFAKNVGRFMVEYGLQSYPHPATLALYLDSTDLRLGSAALGLRQKSYIGDGEIWRHLRDLREDPDHFAAFAEASQRAQAHALHTAITAHRNSDGHCMGSLLWQLNDCWPGPSWSIIDYSGRKKLAYDAVKEAFTK